MIYNHFCMLSMFTMCLCSFFGHFNQRSEWQLIKIDYKSIYSRKCTEEDYQTWHLHNQVRKIKTLSAVDMHVFFFVFFSVQAIQMNITHSSCVYFANRVSHVWWDKNKFTWSAGLEITACWERTTPESSQRSPVFAELMILNGKMMCAFI